MVREGIIVNGAIIFDDGSRLPEGARVRVELASDDEKDNLLPLPSTESYEEHLSILRQSHEDAKAGLGRPAREILEEMARRHNLPLPPGE